jgi:biotin transport system substrate-specific component
MNGNLISTVWPQSQTQLASKALLVLLGVALLTLSAKVQVPFWPVPMTLQTLVVLLIGATSGARLAGATLGSYLAIGAIGVPVFASGAGIAYMFGPTGGYLLGFFAAAVLLGYLADRGMGRSLLSALLLFAIGEVVIFAVGTTWLATLIGAERAVGAGLTPFIPAEILKVALASAILFGAWKKSQDQA